MIADCPHCKVHIGEIGDEFHEMYKYCPYCGEPIAPVIVE